MFAKSKIAAALFATLFALLAASAAQAANRYVFPNFQSARTKLEDGRKFESLVRKELGPDGCDPHHQQLFRRAPP